MVKAKADPAPLTAREAKQQAVARVLATRRPDPRYRTYQDAQGDEVRVQADGPEFTQAATISEWVDDRLCRIPLGSAATEALILLYERCRGGAGEAAAAVAVADGLDGESQFQVWMSLNAAPGAKGEAAGLRAAIQAAWRARGLAVSREQRPPGWAPEPPDLNVVRPQVTKYRTPWGQPASLPV